MFVTVIHSNNVVLTINVRIPYNVVLTINVRVPYNVVLTINARVPVSTLSKQQNEYIVPVLLDFVYETRQPPRCHADAPCKSSLSFLKSPLLTGGAGVAASLLEVNVLLRVR